MIRQGREVVYVGGSAGRAFEVDPLRGVCDRPDCRCRQDRRDLLAGRLSGIYYGTGEPA